MGGASVTKALQFQMAFQGAVHAGYVARKGASPKFKAEEGV